jgi:putative transposase
MCIQRYKNSDFSFPINNFAIRPPPAMASIFRSLLFVIAGASQRELARQVRYLKVENEVLRAKLPARITITPKERQRLLKFGAKLGKAIHQMVTIVTPGTFLRWIREEKRAGRRSLPIVKRGRRRTAEQIRKLIIKFAKENAWGYTRIVGELRKLRIRSVSKSTVRNILKDSGLDPCPKRSGATWDDFLSRHAASLWQADFLTQKVLTVKGIRNAFLLVFLHVESRRVIFSPATLHPDEEWVTAQAESFVREARNSGLRVRFVQHDRDSKFAKSFDRALARMWAKAIRTPRCAPDCQAFVERFLRSLRYECLNHFVFFGTKHLDSVAASYRAHYQKERPHQGKDNELLIRTKMQKNKSRFQDQPAADCISLADIHCHKRLGGLLKHYSRKAA